MASVRQETMMRHRLSTVLTYAALGLASASCGEDLLAPLESAGEHPARIVYLSVSQDISVPTTARMGVDVTVSIRTFIGRCISPGRTEVSQHGRQVDIYPFDIFPSNDCPGTVQSWYHAASFIPTRRGRLIVLIHGTSLSQVGNETQRHTVTIRRVMSVQ